MKAYEMEKQKIQSEQILKKKDRRTANLSRGRTTEKITERIKEAALLCLYKK